MTRFFDTQALLSRRKKARKLVNRSDQVHWSGCGVLGMTLTMAPKARSAKGSVRMLVFDKGRVPNATGVVAKLTRYG